MTSFRTHDGQHYLRVYSPDTPGVASTLWANATGVGVDEEFEVVPVRPGVVALRVHGLYLCGEPDGRVIADRTVLDTWEHWRVVPGDGGIGLQSVAWGYYLAAEGGGGGAVGIRRDYDRPHSWETFAPSTPLDGVVPGEHADPLVGQLRIEHGAYVDDTGPRIPCFLHAGDLIGHGLIYGVDAILPTFDMAARLGYHGLRSWFQLKITTGTWLPGPTTHGWDPRDNPGRFVEILAAAAARGLKWNLAAGGIKGLSNSAEGELFDLVGDAIDEIGSVHFARIVGGNEIRDTGDTDDHDPRELERLVQRVRARHPRILYALGVWTGTEDEHDLRRFTASFQREVLIHGYRDGRVHDKIRHYFNNGYEGPGRWDRAPGQVGDYTIEHDEPLGVGRLVSASGNVHELGAAEMQLVAAAAAIGRGAWTYFCGPGIVLGDEPWEAMPGLAETPALLRQLPQDLHRFQIRGHAGRSQPHRIHAVRDDRPNVRADYAIDPHSGRFVEVQYGPPDEPKDLPAVRGTTDEQVLVESPWGRLTSGRLS